MIWGSRDLINQSNMSAQYATSYEASPAYDAPAGGAATTSPDSGVIDRSYYRGIPGILKYCEMGFCLIAFICVTASLTCSVWFTSSGYFNFITMAALITTLFLYIIFLFKLQKRVFRCACIHWPLVELCYYSVLSILLFFGDLFLSLHACLMSQQAGVAFGWFALIAYGVDLVFAALAFRKDRMGRSQSQQTETHFSSVTTSSRY